MHVFWDDQRRKIHVERILYQRSVGNTGSFEPVARSTDRNDVADAWAVDPP
ncbi:MAG: hypothetical protein HY744_20280 [Deltaproteobacteria bacterium]|nr:hypothetical protein [Deltaproteobacteria bacterium]